MVEKKKGGAPIGNKYAVGNPNSGRPKKYDLEKEAQDLLDWSLLDTSLRLYSFTNDKDYCTSDLPSFAKENEVFGKALKKAKERLAVRREEHANDDMINPVVYNKTHHIYDHEIRDNDESIKDKDLERKIKLAEYQAKVVSEQNKAMNLPPREEILLLEDEIIKLKSKLRNLSNASQS